MDPAHSAALKLLARRELSAAQLRVRLIDRGYSAEAIDASVAHLRRSGALDDARVARAYARTAASIKGRGRVRVVQELHAMGIDRETVREAVDEVFGEIDEHAAIDKAIAKKTRGGRVASPRDRVRLHQFLVRQGFTRSAIAAAMRKVTDDRI